MDDSNLVPGQRIKLSTNINKLVRFKLHELTDMKEGVIRAFDQHGYWIEGGSLAEYLRKTAPGADASPKFNSLNSNVFTGRKECDKSL